MRSCRRPPHAWVVQLLQNDAKSGVDMEASVFRESTYGQRDVQSTRRFALSAKPPPTLQRHPAIASPCLGVDGGHKARRQQPHRLNFFPPLLPLLPFGLIGTY